MTANNKTMISGLISCVIYIVFQYSLTKISGERCYDTPWVPQSLSQQSKIMTSC